MRSVVLGDALLADEPGFMFLGERTGRPSTVTAPLRNNRGSPPMRARVFHVRVSLLSLFPSDGVRNPARRAGLRPFGCPSGLSLS